MLKVLLNIIKQFSDKKIYILYIETFLFPFKATTNMYIRICAGVL